MSKNVRNGRELDQLYNLGDCRFHMTKGDCKFCAKERRRQRKEGRASK